MRAILIDPVEETVTEVDYDGDFRSIYSLLDITCFTCVQINSHGDVIYIDDEGLMKSGQLFFEHAAYPRPLAGKGLVLGTNDEGETVPPVVATHKLCDDVLFLGEIEPPSAEILVFTEWPGFT